MPKNNSSTEGWGWRQVLYQTWLLAPKIPTFQVASGMEAEDTSPLHPLLFTPGGRDKTGVPVGGHQGHEATLVLNSEAAAWSS